MRGLFQSHLMCIAFALHLTTMAASATRFEVRSIQVPLNPKVPHMSRISDVQWLRGFQLTASHRAFGGISGLEWYQDRLYAVSDRGYLIILNADFDVRGTLSGVTSAELAPLRSPAGVALEGLRADAEELVSMPDNTLWLTFEHEHRILRYSRHRDATHRNTPEPPALLFKAPDRLPPFAGLEGCPPNGGLEAATVHPSLGFIAIQEHPIEGTNQHPTWIHHEGATTRFVYRGATPFRPTGMTTMSDGDMVTIERHFSRETGPIARIVRISPKAWSNPESPASGQELGRFVGDLTRDNFEAIVNTPLKDGSDAVLIASDDNYAAHQRTLLIHLSLP